MARVLETQRTINREGVLGGSTSYSKDVFDSPDLLSGTRVTGSTGGLTREGNVVDTTVAQRHGKEDDNRGNKGHNLISAYRTRNDGEDQSPVERAKARLASWYVVVPLLWFMLTSSTMYGCC